MRIRKNLITGTFHAVVAVSLCFRWKLLPYIKKGFLNLLYNPISSILCLLNYWESVNSHSWMGICVSGPPSLAPALALGPSLYLTAPSLNLYLPAPAFNFCLLFLHFTLKVCYRRPRCQCVFSLFFQNCSGK